MTRQEYYTGSDAGSEQGWNGICVRCNHNYFECLGNCTCLSCNMQRQDEEKRGLQFDEDNTNAD